MTIKALLVTTFVLGSASAALAKPVITVSGSASVGVGTTSYVRDHRAPVVVRDHRAPGYPAPVYQPAYSEPWFNPNNTRVTASGSTYLGAFGKGNAFVHHTNVWYRPGWFQLTEATRIDSNREFFNLLQTGGSFRKLKLQNLRGRTDIKQVAIEFRTSRGIETQKVRIDSRMDRNNPSLTIDLAGDSRSIQRIIVYGDSGRDSAYQLLAM
jgi:hypothetical protein